MATQHVVLLGASNLVLGWQDLIHALRRTIADSAAITWTDGYVPKLLLHSPRRIGKMPSLQDSVSSGHLGEGEATLTPNPSLKRSANGRPPGPVWRYAVHFRQPGPGVLPLAPA